MSRHGYGDVDSAVQAIAEEVVEDRLGNITAADIGDLHGVVEEIAREVAPDTIDVDLIDGLERRVRDLVHEDPVGIDVELIDGLHDYVRGIVLDVLEEQTLANVLRNEVVRLKALVEIHDKAFVGMRNAYGLSPAEGWAALSNPHDVRPAPPVTIEDEAQAILESGI